MNDLVENVARNGVALIFANVLLQQLGLPIPAVPTLIVAGALVANGRLSGPAVFAVACVATLLADTVWFALGKYQGRAILKLLCRVSLSPDSCVRETEGRFERWGLRSLLVAKFVPGFSTVAPPLAGAAGSRLGPFLLYSAGGTALWAGSAIAGGMLFHRTVERLLERLSELGSAALYVVGAALGLYVIVRWLRRRAFLKEFRMTRIHPEELHRLMREGQGPLVVDVRAAGARTRDGRRVPGSVVMQTPDFEATLGALDRGREIVLYCT